MCAVLLQRSFSEHATLNENTVTQLLAEIGLCNASYPVKRVYKQLMKRKQQQQQAAEKTATVAPGR